MAQVLFVSGFIKFYNFLVKPLIQIGFKLYYFKYDKLKQLPKCKSNLLLLPANILAKKIRNKEITSQELIQVFIDRIKEIQPLVNCVVQTRFEEALQEAKLVDEILSGSEIPEHYSEKNAPLLGVPFSCKEIICVQGMSNTCGLICRKEIKSEQDAVVVKHMKNSGAILICTTNTSELSMWVESSNYLTGTTRNPYNLSRTAGGSSGGEGSLISSGGSIIGLASDIGGSIRIPSFFNGIYGHKPSSNLISNDFLFPPAFGLQESMLGIGPMCRYASDLKLMMKIMMGHKYEIFRSKFEQNLDLKKLKFYYINDLNGSVFLSEQSQDVKNGLKKAIQFIEANLDLKFTEIKLEKLNYCYEMYVSLMKNGKQSLDLYSKLLTNNKGKINSGKELAKSILGLQNEHTLPVLFLAFMEQQKTPNPLHFIDLLKQLKHEIQNIIKDDGIILFPTFTRTAPFHNQILFTNTIDFIYCGLINGLGFPSTQIPLGLSSDGLPIGIQLIANHSQDFLTIKLAEYFESNLIGWVPPF